MHSERAAVPTGDKALMRACRGCTSAGSKSRSEISCFPHGEHSQMKQTICGSIPTPELSQATQVMWLPMGHSWHCARSLAVVLDCGEGRSKGKGIPTHLRLSQRVGGHLAVGKRPTVSELSCLG